MDNKEKNKHKIKLNFNEMKYLLFEYSDINKKCPSEKTVYENQHIGTFLKHIKRKLTQKTEQKYLTLGQNKYVKKVLDDYLDSKGIK